GKLDRPDNNTRRILPFRQPLYRNTAIQALEIQHGVPQQNPQHGKPGNQGKAEDGGADFVCGIHWPLQVSLSASRPLIGCWIMAGINAGRKPGAKESLIICHCEECSDEVITQLVECASF